MSTLRDLKRRIRSVTNTQQITKAMSMVAAAKLRRAQDKVGAARPYAEKLSEVLGLVASSSAAQEHPFFQKRDGGKEALLLVTSDRGLCGSYNTHLCRTAEKYIAESGRDTSLVIVGKKGAQYFRFRGAKITKAFEEFGDQVDADRVRELNRTAIDLFERREADRVSILSMSFISVARREPAVVPFLPVAPPEKNGDAKGPARDYIFEPSEEEIFAEIIPRYTYARFYSVLAESYAAEHSARMMAMNNATKNAGELIEALTLQSNRIRQAAITSELADIVGAVEAQS